MSDNNGFPNPSQPVVSHVPSHSSQMVKKKLSTGNWIMICTAVSSVLFTLSMILLWCSTIIYYNEFDWKAFKSDKDSSDKAFNKIAVLLYFTMICNIGAYDILLLICFERMNSVFASTRFRLSKRTVLVVRCLIGIYSVCNVIALISYATGVVIVATLAAIPILLIFPLISLWITYSLFSSTLKIAKNTENEERSIDLLNGVLRLTIVTSLALISSMVFVTAFFIAFASLQGSNAAQISSSWIWNVDLSTSTVCLFLVFREHHDYYYRILGGLHEFILNRYLI